MSNASRPKRPMPWPLRAAIVVLLLGSLYYLWHASTHAGQFRAQVCVTYQGRSACRIAEGRTQAEAIRAAHDNACAQITSGVTGTLGCQNTLATSTTMLN